MGESICKASRIQKKFNSKVFSSKKMQLNQKMGNILNRHFSKEDIQTAKYMKYSTSLVIREIQIKPEGDVTSLSSEWLLSKRQKISAGEGVQKRGSCTRCGNEN
jgi:hypothetical protein